jgi:hypothetical protein
MVKSVGQVGARNAKQVSDTYSRGSGSVSIPWCQNTVGRFLYVPSILHSVLEEYIAIGHDHLLSQFFLDFEAI